MKTKFIHGTPNRPEFGEMFGGFLTEHDGRAFVIDCGVGSGAKSMVQRLKDELGPRPLAYVLLTHIHMDHAGALAEICRAWPECKAVAHQKGLRHLERPERLWASTREVMGELAEMYGKPEPIDPARLIPHTEADIPGLAIIETPGHAPHHLSFRLGETLFAGEAGGCPYIHDKRLYNRPATPPSYFPAVTMASADRLLEGPDGLGYFAHTHEMIPIHDCLNLYKRQLTFWDEVLRRPGSARREGEDQAEHLDRLTDLLFQEDENLRPFNDSPPVDLWREKYFMRNSVRGFLEHYESAAEAVS
ncbi:MBL fold metallo-hydrolase [Deltaproteobacteria bacterium OttesenSCG-928-M10]|nr:MBL fold metallo-hydrolase [Deltaproteobacteria bacterium OttesenSCG-928-M10]